MSAAPRPAPRPWLRSILLATDFSNISSRAAAYARALANHYGARLSVVHVLAPGTKDNEFECELAAGDVEIFLAENALTDLPHDAEVRTGEIVGAVNSMVAAREIDLLVLATHGRTGVSRFMLRSVAATVFRHALCPVLTVGPNAKDVNAKSPFRNVLFATDFSEHAPKVLDYALAIARHSRGHLTLLNVVDDSLEALFGHDEDVVRRRRDKLLHMIETEALIGRDVSIAVHIGSAAHGIVDAAVETEADVIVIGARRGSEQRRSEQRHSEESHSERHVTAEVPWGTAYRVVCAAPCPVLTVPHDTFAHSQA